MLSDTGIVTSFEPSTGKVKPARLGPLIGWHEPRSIQRASFEHRALRPYDVHDADIRDIIGVSGRRQWFLQISKEDAMRNPWIGPLLVPLVLSLTASEAAQKPQGRTLQPLAPRRSIEGRCWMTAR